MRLVRRGRCSSRSWHASCAVGRLRLLLLCSCSFHLQLLQPRNQSAHVDVIFMVIRIHSTPLCVEFKGRSKQVLAVGNEGTNHAKTSGGGPTNESSGDCCLANVRAKHYFFSPSNSPSGWKRPHCWQKRCSLPSANLSALRFKCSSHTRYRW